jgi:hypothetical protein
MEACTACGQNITEPDDLLRTTSGQVVCFGCFVEAIRRAPEPPAGAIAHADQEAAEQGSVLVEPRDLVNCRSMADVDALIERVLADRRLLADLEP